MMNTTGLSRQIATGLAAFFLTALLVLATMPQRQAGDALWLAPAARP